MAENIFLFVPNLIGYIRIILGLVSFYYLADDWTASIIAYTISVLLDAIDGYAARWLNQSTRFGAILDQLTDRCSTMILMSALTRFYPQYSYWLHLSMVIDIACHWLYLHATLLQGKSTHKSADNFILNIYYSYKPVLFGLCVANELFYVALYTKHFESQFDSAYIPLLNATILVTLPLAILKAFVALTQLFVGCRTIAAIDVAERSKLSKAH